MFLYVQKLGQVVIGDDVPVVGVQDLANRALAELRLGNAGVVPVTQCSLRTLA